MGILFPPSEINIEENLDFKRPYSSDIVHIRYNNILRILIVILFIVNIIVIYTAYTNHQTNRLYIYIAFMLFMIYMVVTKHIFSSKPTLSIDKKGIEYKGQLIPWNTINDIYIHRRRRRRSIISKLMINTPTQSYAIPLNYLTKSVKEMAHLVHCFKNEAFT